MKTSEMIKENIFNVVICDWKHFFF